MPTDNRRAGRDDNQRPILVPQFAAPDPPPPPAEDPTRPAGDRQTEPLPTAAPEPPPGRRQGLAGRLGLPMPKPDTPDDGTRSPTSSPGSGRTPVGAAEAAALIAGLLGVLALGAAWFVQLRTGGYRTLRKPTKQQTRDIAGPLAAIASRHVPADLLHADLGDAIHALTAAGAYVTAGPLTVPALVDEAGPNQEEQ